MSGRRSNKQRMHGPPSASLSGASVTAAELERLRKSEVDNRAKIKALETDVTTLKARLDGLRRAKNTTIVRREREEIRISSPHNQSLQASMVNSSRTPSIDKEDHDGAVLEQMKELKSQIDNLKAQLLSEKTKYEEACTAFRTEHANDLALLRERHQEELKKWQDQVEELRKNRNQTQALDDEKSQALQTLEAEVKWLRQENSDLSSKLKDVLLTNEALCVSSKLLQEKSDALLEELSIKEAEWSQREDRLNAEIRKQWGDRYHEWMTKAEKKMEELQQINTILQNMLKTKQENDL